LLTAAPSGLFLKQFARFNGTLTGHVRARFLFERHTGEPLSCGVLSRPRPGCRLGPQLLVGEQP
jgi:hypothetical protein